MKKPDDILNAIEKAYGVGEPILTDDLLVLFQDAPRRTVFEWVAKLVNEGRMKRYESGVYYIPTTTIAGEAPLNPIKVIERKYIKGVDGACGYWSGATLDNNAGITEQVPAVYEVVTNNTGTAQRKVTVGGFLECIIRKARIPIDSKNVQAQQVLDVLTRRSPMDMTDEQSKAVAALANGIPATELQSMSLLWPQKTTRRVIEGEACGVFA